ncbi:MAG: RIP metalloprotease [Actinomycetota bacterium]|nr:RIP metalloprotease [Actinomycetota bacterium]
MSSSPESAPAQAAPQGAPGARAALARLAAVVVGLVVLAAVFHSLDLLGVIAAIVAIVMLHEAGHFAMAKLGGMKVTEYFFGFGPTVWSIRRGETTYGVKAIPAGGYVRIPGMSSIEEVDESDEPHTYRQASFPRRLGVAVAGSVVHFLIAFVLLWCVLVFAGVGAATGTAVAELPAVTGPAVSPAGSPAHLAGLRTGDLIVSIDGKKATDPNRATSLLGDARPGVTLSVVVERDGRRLTLHIVPVPAAGTKIGGQAPAHDARAVVGVQLATPVVRSSPLAAFGQSAVDLGRFSGQLFAYLGHFFSIHGLSNFTHQLTSPSYAQKASQQPSSRPESIIGAVRTATQAAQAGWAYIFLVLVSLNLFLGIFNMFPLPPLDGGHVAVAVYERIRSRRGKRYHADAEKLLPLTYAVVALLVVLGLSVAYLDLAHPLANPFR